MARPGRAAKVVVPAGAVTLTAILLGPARHIGRSTCVSAIMQSLVFEVELFGLG